MLIEKKMAKRKKTNRINELGIISLVKVDQWRSLQLCSREVAWRGRGERACYCSCLEMSFWMSHIAERD